MHALTATAYASVAIVVGLAACKGEPKPGDSEVVARRTVVADERRKPSRTEESPPFHLLGTALERAGAEPRATLRYGALDELRTRATVRAEIAVKTARAAKRSRVSVETGLAISRVGGDGDRVRLDIVGLRPGGDDHPAVARYRELVAGVAASATIDKRGLIQRITGSATLEQKRELAAHIARSLIALPDEPVGLGARWRVKYALGRGGIYVAQTTTYELVARDGDRIDVKVAVVESAEPQPILRGSQMVANLLGFKSSARGVAAASLDRLVIDRGRLEIATTFHARANGAEIFRETTTTLEISAEHLKVASRH